MMNLYAFSAKLLGLGLAAGAAFATVKLVEKIWPKTGEEDFEYIAAAGKFLEDDTEADAGNTDAASTEGCGGAKARAKTPEAADAPNENPVDAPPAVPVTDPLKIADPADFQPWDDLGCQG